MTNHDHVTRHVTRHVCACTRVWFQDNNTWLDMSVLHLPLSPRRLVCSLQWTDSTSQSCLLLTYECWILTRWYRGATVTQQLSNSWANNSIMNSGTTQQWHNDITQWEFRISNACGVVSVDYNEHTRQQRLCNDVAQLTVAQLCCALLHATAARNNIMI